MSGLDQRPGVAIDIGGMPILLRTGDSGFRRMLESRYSGFIGDSKQPRYAFDVELLEPSEDKDADENVIVQVRDGNWHLKRGDFEAEWDARSALGRIRQAASPYAIDSVLRIVHTLILAEEGGFLLHAASGIRGGRAYLFAGVSGAGKTTISRLAPPDVTLLTDEVSYVRREGGGYRACGTPFSGELAKPGENQSAPVSTLFLLAKGPANRVEDIDVKEAARLLLRNILFFAEDTELVKMVFQSACEFVSSVPVKRLTFVPDQRVWEMIRQS